jgi:CBS domain-containing protein
VIDELDDAERPILVRDVVRADGSHALGLRVFCPRQSASLPVDVCRACPSCVEIAEGSDGDVVRCAPRARPAAPRVEGGTSPSDGVAIGVLLRGPILAVDGDLPLRRLASLFVERRVPYVFVVGPDATVLGVARERDLVRAISPESIEGALRAQRPMRTVEIMSGASAVTESTPLRRALLQMAVAHVRQVPIVTPEGVLLGVLSDVDGLRLLAARMRAAR